MRFLQRGWSDGSNDGSLGITPQSILKDAGQLRVSIANVLIAASNSTMIIFKRIQSKNVKKILLINEDK